MPTYGYECAKCKEKFEVIQRMSDDPLVKHDACGGKLQRLLYPVGIVFKGSGFHVNDYGRNGRNEAPDSKAPSTETKADSTSDSKPESTSDSTAKTDSKTDSKTEPKTEPKSETKKESTPTSSST